MKISIIGSGWLAQPLARSLTDDGHAVVMTTTQDHKTNELNAAGLPCIKYQLGDEIEPLADFFTADVLIIAITNKDVPAFQNLVNHLDPSTTQHLIYISSTSVYANSITPHTEHSSQLNTQNPLLAIEKLIQKHPKATVLRCAGLVGPKRHPGRFFAGNKTITNPTARVNLIHLDDCIGIIKIIITQQAWGTVFNGCADNHPEKGQFYPTMAAHLGLPSPQVNSHGSKTLDKVIDNSAVKKQLNYIFKFPDVYQMKY